MDRARSKFSWFAIATLLATLGVILWGAYVRASGSGAGCGSHWPTCNGVVIPRSPTTATMIEYTHRITSGVSLIMVVAQVFLAFRWTPPGNMARRASFASLFFMLTEAAVGAGLVIFEKVAGDKSLGRAWFMGVHLINTFFLLASLGVVVWAARVGEPGAHRTLLRRRSAVSIGAALFAMLATGVTGAIAALGDTLFPARSLREGIAADLDAQAHLFVQLRVFHPFVAVFSALVLLLVASSLARQGSSFARRMAQIVGVLTLVQVGAGIVNLVLLAPVAMQIVHLIIADALWLSLIFLGAELHVLPTAGATRDGVVSDQDCQSNTTQATTSTTTTQILSR